MNKDTKKPLLNSLLFTNFITLLISTLLVASLIYILLHNQFMDDISKKDKIVLESFSSNVNFFLSDSVDVLEYIALMTSTEEPQNISTVMEKQNSIDQYFENIEILNLKGNVIYTLPGNEKEIGHTRNGEDYYLQLQKQGIYWSNPFISSTTGNATVVVSLLSDENIIVGFLDLSYLNKLTAKTATELGSNFQVSIIDSYGIYVSTNDMLLVEQRRPIDQFDRIKSLTKSSGYTSLEKNDTNYLLLAESIEQTKWYILIYDDYATTFESYHAMIYAFMALLILSLIAYLVVSSLRTSSVRKNIDSFVYQTQKIAEGNYTVTLPEQKFDEFHKLASNFEGMLKTLKQRDHDLLGMAYHDTLTGLVNRAYLYQGDWMKAVLPDQACCLIYFDLDNFKNINDNYGHLFGDELLVAVAERISQKHLHSGITARIGGDEFVIILHCQNCVDASITTAINILETIQTPIELNGKIIHITASAGIASSGAAEGIEISNLLKSADIALYEAKKIGKNCYKVFSDDMDNKVARRLEIESHLRHALVKNEMHLVFQPQYDASKKTIRGFEALLRWESATLGTVNPVEFIPIAEETGMIVEIGRWVLKTACETIKQLNETFQNSYIVSVNVSPYEFTQPGFLDYLIATVSESKLDTQLLELEITENVLLDSTIEVIDLLNLIRARQIKISLDDFGTGYSSLSYLHKLPITTLKIDKSFVFEMLLTDFGKRMVDSIIIMGHYLDLEIIAEGVENQLQAEALSNISCDYIQGYHYSKPLGKEELVEYLTVFSKNI